MSKKLVETDPVCKTIAHTAILIFHGNFILTKQNMRPRLEISRRIYTCTLDSSHYRLQNSRVFFSKSVKKSVKRAVRVLRARSARASQARRACEAREKKPRSRSLFSASFQTFCLTTRAYLNTQKYGLFRSL